ncbi:MAG: hypothetical protein ACT4P1_15795 [Sporichthyaceae bacterium]
MGHGHVNENAQAQHIAQQLLQGSAPGSMATWGMNGEAHGGAPGQHPYGEHVYAGYVRGDGSVYGTMIQPG